jgi:CDP-glucose 4,6-dehydratase
LTVVTACDTLTIGVGEPFLQATIRVRHVKNSFGGIFQGMPVLVTGHTGFKGSWLSIWLNELGAKVIGYSLDPPTAPSNFEASQLAQRVIDIRNDIRQLDALRRVIEKLKPRVVFHLAAQPIVRVSYTDPKSTFDVNVGGTVSVLEAVRLTTSVEAVVCITSDKCYQNQEWTWGYREIDQLGGRDPYSASKAMAELAISSYRQSFFPADRYQEHKVAIASTRAGNVIGGGDWAKDRLVSDCVRALMEKRTIGVRNPRSVRPWQFILEPLSGYLWLAAKLLQEGSRFAEAWNFGPPDQLAVSVQELVERLIGLWGEGGWEDISSNRAPHEADVLRLSWEKAANLLGWQPVYTWDEALTETVNWFKEYHKSNSDVDMYDTCVEQIRCYVDRARELGIAWTQ